MLGHNLNFAAKVLLFFDICKFCAFFLKMKWIFWYFSGIEKMLLSDWFIVVYRVEIFIKSRTSRKYIERGVEEGCVKW